MVPDFVALYAVVIVLFSLIYFSFASIPFLFVRFDVPEVSRLFRGLFNSHFWIVGVTGLVAAAVFAASGRMAFTAEMLLLAATAMAVRGRVLQLIDTQQTAWQSGDNAADASDPLGRHAGQYCHHCRGCEQRATYSLTRIVAAG
jgi:hypothetical protein